MTKANKAFEISVRKARCVFSFIHLLLKIQSSWTNMSNVGILRKANSSDFFIGIKSIH